MALTILGLSGALSHDPSAALYIDGKLIAAVEEERFVRDKHAKNRMPYESAKFCLEQAGIKPSDVDVVAIPFAPISIFEKARWHYAKRYWYAPDRALDAILMGNDDIYRCYSIGQQIFSQAGYVQDCHNRYAIPCRGGFLQEDYLFDGMSVIGLGAGARSYARNIQYRNVHSLNGRVAIAQYIATISSGRNAVTATFVVDDDERARQYAIGHIESLDRAAFSRSFGPFEMRLPEELRQLQESGIAHIDESIIALNPDGLKYRDLVARMFFSPASRSKEREYRSGVAG